MTEPPPGQPPYNPPPPGYGPPPPGYGPLAFGLFAGFTLYFVLDHGQGPIAAIKSSFALVTANFGNALVAMLLAALVASGGFLACFLGLIFTVPFAMLLHVYTYRFLSGGTVAP